MTRRGARAVSLAGLALALACQGDVPDPDEPEPETSSGPVAMRRLTTADHARSVRAVFGDDLVLAVRLEPDVREAGLLSVGAAQVGVSPSGLEDYEAAARAVAEQAVAPAHRDDVVPCDPAQDACVRDVLTRLGRLLWRRPLTAEELDGRVALVDEARTALADPYEGLSFGLASLMVAPEFVFRVERLEEVDGQMRLTAHSLATRLAYLLWGSGPDEALLDAADDGTLHDPAVLAAQVDRMIADARFEEGVRALFSDLFQLAELDRVRKDPDLFPAFDEDLLVDAREETLTLVTDLLVRQAAPLPELYRTRESWLTRRLGLVYREPVTAAEGLERVVRGDDSPRAGVLAHMSLLALFSHPGRSSPTLRGRFVREVLLCGEVPPPPPDVDFSAVEDAPGNKATARERLSVHATNPACVGCHEQMDPIGLGLEPFDALGAFRTEENDVPIDASGELDGVAFTDAAGLAEAVASHPDLPVCFADKVWRHAVGREAEAGEAGWLVWLDGRFAANELALPALMKAIATSEAFRKASGPRQAEGAP